MEYENIVYATVQIVHNLGAVTVVGAPVTAPRLWTIWTLAGRQESLRQMTWLMIAGWLLQILTGIGFGLVSLFFYAQLPDIAGIALGALVIKIACAILGVVLGAICLRRGKDGRAGHSVWRLEIGLGITALIAAGLLRWFS